MTPLADLLSFTDREVPATLGAHIRHVVRLGPDEEVGRPNAWRVIAVVERLHADRNRATIECKG